MKEIWKDVPGYEGLYKVSNMGKVLGQKGQLLKPNNTKRGKGYLQLNLCGKMLYVHRLVMLAFVGPNVLGVNHIDGNPLNNILSNLEYCTQSENLKHATRLGFNKVPGLKGIHSPLAKLNEEAVRFIRQNKGKIHRNELAKKYGVCPPHISAIQRNLWWKHIT